VTIANHLAFPVCLVAFLLASGADAAIYYRGKEVLRNGTPVADVERLLWAPVKDSAGTDRIQGSVDIRARRTIHSIMLVLQAFNSRGKLEASFSITPNTCDLHRKLIFDDENFYPFCGVRISHQKPSPGFKGTERYKKGENAWFYVDFPRNRDIQTIKIVNVIVDGEEVLYNVRIASNILLRSNMQPPEIKHGTEATLGDESSCKEWLPDTSDGNDPAPASRRRDEPKSKVANRLSPAEPMAGGNDFDLSAAAHPHEPIVLDVSALVALRRDFSGKAYKCKTFLDEFVNAVKLAEAKADDKRMQLDNAVSKKITDMYYDAQSAGNIELARTLKNVLASPLEMDNWNGINELSAVKANYAKARLQIDEEQAKSAIAAAKALNAALERQRQAWAQKNDQTVVNTIANFQRELSKWIRDLAEKARGMGQFDKLQGAGHCLAMPKWSLLWVLVCAQGKVLPKAAFHAIILLPC